MSKKKKKAQIVHNSITNEYLFCGFPLILKNRNQLWRWDTLEDC